MISSCDTVNFFFLVGTFDAKKFRRIYAYFSVNQWTGCYFGRANLGRCGFRIHRSVDFFPGIGWGGLLNSADVSAKWLTNIVWELVAWEVADVGSSIPIRGCWGELSCLQLEVVGCSRRSQFIRRLSSSWRYIWIIWATGMQFAHDWFQEKCCSCWLLEVAVFKLIDVPVILSLFSAALKMLFKNRDWKWVWYEHWPAVKFWTQISKEWQIPWRMVSKMNPRLSLQPAREPTGWWHIQTTLGKIELVIAVQDMEIFLWECHL